MFENYDAANSSNVFLRDLRTRLKQNEEVGCVVRQGIIAL